MTIYFEWTAELVDHNGDIVDNAFCDTYAEIVKAAKDMEDDGHAVRIGLVRDRYDDRTNTLACRTWSYIGCNFPTILDMYFTNWVGERIAKVPKRFHWEIVNYKPAPTRVSA